jgi:chromosome segregation ATPase
MEGKPDVGKRLEELASSIRTKLRETGFRIVSIGMDLAEAKRLLGPGKPFELWCVGTVGLSIATAYRWIQAAETFKALKLQERPDLLEPGDVADIISASFPQALRSRILRRVEALDKAEADAKDARKLVEAETRHLAKVETELSEAQAEATKAKAKLEHVTSKANADAKPALDTLTGIESKVRDARTRLSQAKATVVSILESARAKVSEAHAQAQGARQAVAEAQKTEAKADVKVAEAKADVKVEVKAAKDGKGNGKPDELKAKAWDMFLKGWLNTLEAKVRETFPVERQAEALQAIANAVLALSQGYKVTARQAESQRKAA